MSRTASFTVEIVSSDLPDWIPPPGYVANIALNTMNEAWASTSHDGAYGIVSLGTTWQLAWNVWNSGTYGKDASQYGISMFRGGGHSLHQSSGNTAIHGFDYTDRLYKCVNPQSHPASLPTIANNLFYGGAGPPTLGVDVVMDYEYTDWANYPPGENTPQVVHSVATLAYLSAAWAGNNKGYFLSSYSGRKTDGPWFVKNGDTLTQTRWGYIVHRCDLDTGKFDRFPGGHYVQTDPNIVSIGTDAEAMPLSVDEEHGYLYKEMASADSSFPSYRKLKRLNLADTGAGWVSLPVEWSWHYGWDEPGGYRSAQYITGKNLICGCYHRQTASGTVSLYLIDLASSGFPYYWRNFTVPGGIRGHSWTQAAYVPRTGKFYIPALGDATAANRVKMIVLTPPSSGDWFDTASWTIDVETYTKDAALGATEPFQISSGVETVSGMIHYASKIDCVVWPNGLQTYAWRPPI